jgi:hypothetical protein
MLVRAAVSEASEQNESSPERSDAYAADDLQAVKHQSEDAARLSHIRLEVRFAKEPAPMSGETRPRTAADPEAPLQAPRVAPDLLQAAGVATA